MRVVRVNSRGPFVVLASVSVLAAISVLGSGCATADEHGHFARHFEAETLGGSLATQWERSDRRIPELALFATIPIAFAADDETREDHPNDITSKEKAAADTIPILLGVGSLAVGAHDWFEGDGGQSFEAASEALVTTAALTQILKTTVGRQRPDKTSDSSFPSGHTSFAFAGTTLLLRQFEDPNDPSWSPYEILAYLPATWVGIERVRADKHWVSDVAVGAFLGTFVTNWIWDAHFSREDEDRRTVFEPAHKLSWHWSAGSVDGKPTFGVDLAF